jgi:hypothetical protein
VREPTPTQDRTCWRCPVGSYAPNSGASSCLASTTCQPGEYVSAEASATGYRRCSACEFGTFSSAINSPRCWPLRECTPSEFESFAGAPGSNRECTFISSCQPGTFVRAEPTPTQDRRCEACPFGSYSSEFNSRSCAPWRGSCGAEEYEVVAPSPTRDRECATSTICPPGTFVSDFTQWGDRYCTSCGYGEYSAVPNAVSCTPWAACRANEFQVAGSPTEDQRCQRARNCLPGQFVRQQPTPHRDRACAECFSGTFSTSINAAQRQDWSICGVSEIVGQLPSTTQDRICMAPEQCAPGTFRSGSTSAEGSACTPCPAGTFSATVDAANCQPWTECEARHAEVVAPSVTSDRQCDTQVEAPIANFSSMSVTRGYACGLRGQGGVECFGPSRPDSLPDAAGLRTLALGCSRDLDFRDEPGRSGRSRSCD